MSQIHTVRVYNADDELVGGVTVPHRDERAAGHHLSWWCDICNDAGELSLDYIWPQAAEVLNHHMQENHPHSD